MASPAGEVIRDYLSQQVDALIAVDPRVRLNEPDAVHKMRVACRRMRSTMRTFSALFEPDLVARLDVELRDLAGALSGARDTEVQIAYFDGRIDAMPNDLIIGPVKESIDNELAAGLSNARDETLAMLRSDRYLALLTDLESLVAEEFTGPADKPAGKVLPKLVLAADRRLAKKIGQAETASGHERDLQLHSARKQAKRLRYAAEAVTSVYGDEAKAFVKVAEEIQELLGTHQDACVARELLRTWGVQAQADAKPIGFTIGVLLGLEECRAKTAERDFFNSWPEASNLRHRAWLR